MASGRVVIRDSDGQNKGADYRKEVDDTKDTAAPLNFAVCWAAHAHNAYAFKIVWQGLPATPRTLRRDSRLSADDTRAVELGSWVAPAVMSPGKDWRRPQPTVFCEDPDTGKEALSSEQPSQPIRNR